MASNQRVTTKKRAARAYKMGRKRKNEGARKSTLSAEELFAACGEPGKPAPTPAASE